MTTVFNLEISESPQQLQRLLCQHQHARDRDRLRALYLRKTGQVRSRRELAQGCNDSTLYRWFWLYQQQGLEGLLEHRLGALQAGSQAQARAQALSPSRPAAAATVQKKTRWHHPGPRGPLLGPAPAALVLHGRIPLGPQNGAGTSHHAAWGQAHCSGAVASRPLLALRGG